ncbi:unnamed protein product, partial [Aphis gossypii]
MAAERMSTTPCTGGRRCDRSQGVLATGRSVSCLVHPVVGIGGRQFELDRRGTWAKTTYRTRITALVHRVFASESRRPSTGGRPLSVPAIAPEFPSSPAIAAIPRPSARHYKSADITNFSFPSGPATI